MYPSSRLFQALLFALFHLSAALSSSSPDISSLASSTKVVLVTGGSRGIGRATCLLLAKQGWKVALNYCQEEEAAKQVVEQGNGNIVAFQADVSQPDQVARLYEEIYETFQSNPAGLVNNAAIMERMEKDIKNIQHETLLRDLQVNTCGPFYCTQEFVKRASTQNGGGGGSIVCISSISAESAQILAYGMSKAALEAMVAGLSKNLPLEGIRINTIQPGLIDTGLASKEIMDRMSGVIPLRRPGLPEEVAKAVAFLLSDDSSYCSGTKLRIAGGL